MKQNYLVDVDLLVHAVVSVEAESPEEAALIAPSKAMEIENISSFTKYAYDDVCAEDDVHLEEEI